jgi:hypothetical protein
MPLKLYLSQINALPFAFEAAVSDYIAEKMAHRFTVGEPAPSAGHAWVENAVKRVPGGEGKPDDFVADYEIVDDTPPPPTLDEQKQALVAKVHADYHAAQTTMIPPLKARLWGLEHARILTALSTIVPMQSDETSEAHQARALPILAKKAPADAAFLGDYLARQKKMHAVILHLATMESQIHDLTAETIDAWKPAPFPS